MRLTGLSSVVRRFATSVSLSRPGACTYSSAGLAQWGAATVSSILAYVERPASGSDLKTLPEGDRIAGACSIWSLTDLEPRDVLTLGDGERYEVRSADSLVTLAGFCHAVGVKVI